MIASLGDDIEPLVFCHVNNKGTLEPTTLSAKSRAFGIWGVISMGKGGVYILEGLLFEIKVL